jgi:hypothetical protein
MAILPILEPVPIPDPPPGLTAEQAALWKTILCSKPPDWFDQSNLPLLTALVRHITTYERLCEQIERYGVEDIEQIDTVNKLLAMRDREGKAMASMATKLRLTIQSKYEPERAKNIALRGGRMPQPWEDEDDNPFSRNGRRP